MKYESKRCGLCDGSALESVGLDNTGIYFSGGSSRPPQDQRFRFCPKCGRNLNFVDAKNVEPSPKIYGVDFDETLFFGYKKCVWPAVGDVPNLELITFLIEERRKGNRVILVTMREGDSLSPALSICKRYGLEFDAVNDNLPELVSEWKNNPRKIYCDVYIDDKNVVDFDIGRYGI